MGKRNRHITLVVQESMLKQLFPTSKIIRVGDTSLIWKHIMRPNALSDEYYIRMEYDRKKGPEIFVVEPKLILAKGKDLLPHVYSTPKQQLCLYFPDGKEWNEGKLFTQSIIPWISEWLYFYEIWVGRGKWLGGGTHQDEDEINSSTQKRIV